MKTRRAEVSRNTGETDITVTIDLDETGQISLDTPRPFLNHRLQARACHGFMGVQVRARGDIEVDPHHLVEDCGIVLGQALKAALGDFSGIVRCGFFLFPMDGSLAQAAIDLCGRPNLIWKVDLSGEVLGGVQTRLFRDFFKGLADALQATLHLSVPYLDGDHHAVEALFKAFGRALHEAVQPATSKAVMSTKGRIGD